MDKYKPRMGDLPTGLGLHSMENPKPFRGLRLCQEWFEIPAADGKTADVKFHQRGAWACNSCHVKGEAHGKMTLITLITLKLAGVPMARHATLMTG